MTTIRHEQPQDHPAVEAVNRRAFGRAAEAELVAALRRSHHCISLVAEQDGRVVGHILFSPASAVHTEPDRSIEIRLAGLAPMAVLPEHQRRGIGSALVRAGLEACRGEGYQAVVVLGHPEFYPRFGFIPAGMKGLRCEYDVPDPVFMVTELAPGSLAEAAGVVRYAPEFALV